MIFLINANIYLFVRKKLVEKIYIDVTVLFLIINIKIFDDIISLKLNKDNIN